MAKCPEPRKSRTPRRRLQVEPARPLWQRVPSHDEQGRRLSDFMMVVPGLKKRTPAEIQRVVQAMADVLDRYQEVVMYADLNLKINALWVSVRPVRGVCLEIPAAIKVAVPEAMLVAQKDAPD